MVSLLVLSLLVQAKEPATFGVQSAQVDRRTDTAEVLFESARRRHRAYLPWTMGAEIGINGLSGLGYALSYNATRHWSIDSGLGLGLLGIRLGARGRYTFTTRPWSPFVGLGATWWMWNAANLSVWGAEATYTHRPPSLHATVGLGYQGATGFTFLPSLGWVATLDRPPVHSIVRSSPLADGLVVSCNLGRSF